MCMCTYMRVAIYSRSKIGHWVAKKANLFSWSNHVREGHRCVG